MSRARPISRAIRRLSWPWRAALGVAATALGCFLVTSPLDSLDTLALYLSASFLVLGLGGLSRGDRSPFETIVGIAWVVLGLVVLLSPGHLIDALPTVIGIYLLAAGVLKLWRVSSGTIDERVSSLLLGLTQIVLGIVALTWDDLTLLVAAALFGVLLVVAGFALAGEALLHRDRPEDKAPEPAPATKGFVRRWGRVLAAAVALLVSLSVLKFSNGLDDGSPAVDDFYAAPSSVPDQPGSLLRTEPFTTEVPAGAQGWRILYTTTDALGDPTIASAIVVVPVNATGLLPVIAWAHGTTGYARQCAPSLLKQPFTAGAFPDVMDQVVSNGWTVVATDYAGLGTEGHEPYIIGKGEAYSVLDAVRAARQMEGRDPAVDLDDNKTVVWGHSQGGGAALWTNQEQPTYAPDVPLLGTVAMAPAADPLSLARNLPNVTGGSVFGSFVAMAYADTYDDLELSDFIKPAAVPFVKKLASRCLSEPGILKSVLVALSLGDQEILSGDPGDGAIGEHLRANIPRDPGPGPLFIAQGEADTLVVPDVTKAYVTQLRNEGHQVEFKTYPGLDHMPLVQADSSFLPELLAWTKARIDAAR